MNTKNKKTAKKEYSQPKEVKVEFINSPTGLYKLAYHIGDQVLIRRELADKMVKNGDAKII